MNRQNGEPPPTHRPINLNRVVSLNPKPRITESGRGFGLGEATRNHGQKGARPCA